MGEDTGLSIRTKQPGQIWDAALGELQLQVARPAFETWLRDTDGVAHRDGEFIVGTANAFVSEMLEHRMYPLIERAIERVIGEPTSVRFQVVTQVSAPDTKQSDIPAMAAGEREPKPGSTALSPQPSASTPPPSLNSRYTFGRFVVGKSNELAHAAARAVADNPGNIYNPLVLYSDVGLGKTHLMHAIGHQAVSRGMRPVYLTTEEFTNEFIAAIKDGTTEEFRARYRGADMLLLDDIQFLIGKEQMQEGFFHTFNALHMSNRQIVITCDRPVSALRTLEERITSRLEWGLVVDINPPDLETRTAILHAKAEQMGLNIDASALGLLAERISRNIRELEGILNRTVAYAQLTKRTLDTELARHVIEGTLDDSARHQPTEQETLDAVSAHFGVDLETLRGRKRDKKTALARQVAMYILREDAQMNASAIARTLGRKDHTTVLYGCKTIENQQNADAKLRRDILQIRQSMS
jgi:chromosomal replication initiator protein